MENIKGRTPVKCQNEHKALWYWELSNGIPEIRHLGVSDNSKCKCPKFNIGEGYASSGENQLCSNYMDRNGILIYEGDLIKQKHSPYIGLVSWNGQAYWSVFRDGKFNEFLYADKNTEVVGNIWENPELLPKDHLDFLMEFPSYKWLRS